MNFIDRFTRFFSPMAALRREQARMALNVIEKHQRKYDASASSRRTDGWTTVGTSANAEIGPALHRLRGRARDLSRNNPYARRAITSIVTNSVGKGIRPAPYSIGETTDNRINEAWFQWAHKRKAIDYEGKKNFYGIQKLVMRTVAESGECLVVRRRDASLDIPFQLQVLEGDYIDTNRNGFMFDTTGAIDLQGIRISRGGKVLGYWLYESHPGDQFGFNITSKLVPAEDVLHIYEILRPGQVRGVPFGVSAMLRLKDLDDYEDAQLVKQKIAACFTVFVTDTSNVGDMTATATDNLERVEPGIIEHLPVGKDVKFASPPPVEGYAEYTKQVLQGIAMGYGVPYELLTGDLSNVNFSSARMGWLEFHRWIEDLQDDMLIPMLCDPVWEWFMEGMIMRGKIKENVDALWTPPKREMINPKEEIQAAKDMVRNGFSSWSEQVRSFGYDPTDVITELKKDAENVRQNKLMLDSFPEHDNNRVKQKQALEKQPPA